MSFPERLRLTIPTGSAFSPAADLGGSSVLVIGLVSGTPPVTTDLEVQTSFDGVTWVSAYDMAGNHQRILAVNLAVGRSVPVTGVLGQKLLRTRFYRYRLAAATGGADVNATSDLVIGCVYEPNGLY